MHKTGEQMHGFNQQYLTFLVLSCVWKMCASQAPVQQAIFANDQNIKRMAQQALKELDEFLTQQEQAQTESSETRDPKGPGLQERTLKGQDDETTGIPPGCSLSLRLSRFGENGSSSSSSGSSTANGTIERGSTASLVLATLLQRRFSGKGV